MPRKPILKQQNAPPPALAALGARVSAGAIFTVMIAVSCGITLVALSFAIYAELEIFISPAFASAGTALIFAVIAGLIGLAAPRIIQARALKAAPEPELPRPLVDSSSVRLWAEVAIAVAGGLVETALRSRKTSKLTRASRSSRHA